ncbi:unnamed protein product [Clonostachys byssicola]|uniref:NmrA-like domain-containing protein n=1 Tax=Clonostachys byssicola TaxID=160290 RepID=A0A9N9U0E8_9HYPO|nr:unnamed protein product [Clonostachys byssicola]
MSTIKNVVLIGASGTLGPHVAKQVIDSGLFNVTTFKRIGSVATYYTGSGSAKVVEVDLSSQTAVESALKGQDAIVATLSATAIESQKPIIDAAASVGVKRYIPSEFGGDLENPRVRTIPILGSKLEIQGYLADKAKTSNLTYTLVFNAAFIEWGIEKQGLIDRKTDHPSVFGDGDLEFSATSLPTVGDAIVGILQHPEETKNRSVRIHDLVLTQNKIIELAKKAVPERNWEAVPEDRSLADYLAIAYSNLQQGIFNDDTIKGFINTVTFDPAFGTRFLRTDNELLGIKPRGEEYIVQMIKNMFN